MGAFNTHSISLRYTPRQMCLLEHCQLVIVEADINEYGVEEKKKMGFDATGFDTAKHLKNKKDNNNDTNNNEKKVHDDDDDDDAMDMDDSDSDDDDNNNKPKEEKKVESKKHD